MLQRCLVAAHLLSKGVAKEETPPAPMPGPRETPPRLNGRLALRCPLAISLRFQLKHLPSPHRYHTGGPMVKSSSAAAVFLMIRRGTARYSAIRLTTSISARRASESTMNTARSHREHSGAGTLPPAPM